jgi:hypothetical protein
MIMGRWLGVLIACCGFEVACSSVGPLDDGIGGSGGLSTPTGEWDPGGASGRAGRPMRPAGSGGIGGVIGGGATGGSFGQVSANELSCLKPLFAVCPTDVGACGIDVGLEGLGGRAGSGGSWGTGGTIGASYCFDSGIRVVAATQSAPCPESSAAWDTEWEVYKPDGSVCYTISRYRDCGDRTEIVTVRDGSGAVVGSGSANVLAGTPATRSFTCVNGDSCQDSNCNPYVPLSSCTGTCR